MILMITTSCGGNYIPVSIDDSKMSTEDLKKEREFLQFLIDLIYFQKRNYIMRILTPEMKEDMVFRYRSQNEDIGVKMWMLRRDELVELKDGISREIMRRNKKQPR